MNKLATRQRTLAASLTFSGYGVHSAQPVTLSLSAAAPDSGFIICRELGNGTTTKPVQVHFSRVSRTTLCTTLDLGDSVSVATIEHVISALSGMGVDNALITLDGPECPILDGSARPFAEAILKVGLAIQPAQRKFLKVIRAVTVRNNDAFAALEPYNGRSLDLEIDFDSTVIGRQRMIFDWTPRRFYDDVSLARTFGFAADAKVLRQAGYALGSSLDNSITVHEDRVLNPGGLRYEDEFVRHKLLDAIGDLALGGLPIWGRFRSYKGGHALNAHVLAGLFSSEANYEIVGAEDLPLEFEAFDDQPEGLPVNAYLRAVR
ncbi:UDP-3-O-acyl-N-acetylglucosamine deacetylase [Devosia sp. RR2S18]|jgi:UDP-3-O-[3-hydroxymyristoyl] N-acetylglucosamine deacetylase|uniref:UDP-3-O-acyl-N-acetylglucosamine deacetylase n=1 Tax=Devosia rhizosphaerae TaxID=3049774 RepID=UPI00254264D4|nr:UDP-3-O-acyl-N-acetylglucosamine deacetylase [Devosia sp. RR2S18]WIJ26522.1 UDP-3-O-acyl-N-acetylglucosamine deacetylase [Devosia sp. RR2S18]HEV7292529.1 UDP-3-O-acyl-N-acetylglucosamine deacetylase [Devosia sp.]